MVLNTIFLVREIRRNEQHDSFINAVTHELKTPVASIRLYLQTLQTRELDEAKRREFYRIMLEDSDRLLHTIEQVLRAGSVASWPRLGRSPRTRVNLAELVAECVELARTRFRLDGEALSYEPRLEAGRSYVTGDPEELKTAIWNLIDNAIKYSPGQPLVWVRCHRDRDRAAICVVDRGVGIPRSEQRSIFGKFVRGRAAIDANVKGTGVGLSMVQQIVAAHGGEIQLQSEPGQGSTFTLLLPAADVRR
jgi:signal transduction histidine kinase